MLHIIYLLNIVRFSFISSIYQQLDFQKSNNKTIQFN